MIPIGFRVDYGAKYPKAVGSLRRDATELLTFFDFPAEHGVGVPFIDGAQAEKRSAA